MAFKLPHTIYCDGASRKDGRGGWGFVVYFHDDEIDFKCGGAYDTTNNRMELTAAIEALKWAKSHRGTYTIACDSQYVIKGVTEYLDAWLQMGWRTGANKPVKNDDLWEILGHLDCDVQPRWEWVRGHNGDVGNERADELAGLGIPKER